ncbi:MAG: PQQ-binding-like beta-propeller repeat protein [Coriobacteriia bacterium]
MARRRTTGTSRRVSRGRLRCRGITPSVIVSWLLLLVALAVAGYGLFSGVRAAGAFLAIKGAQITAPPDAKPAAEKTAKKPATKKPALPPLALFKPTPGQPVDKGDGVKISTFLGNSTRRFYGIGPVPEQLRVIWKTELGSGKTSGTASSKGPVTWAGSGWTGQPTLVRDKGKLYLLIGGFDHGLRKIDAATGKTIWRYEFPDVIKGTNTVWIDQNAPDPDGRIRVVCGSRRGTGANLYSSLEAVTPVRCVSFETGKELWRLPVPHTLSYSRDADGSALMHKGRLYQGVESGNLYGLDPNYTSPLGVFRQPLVTSQTLLYEKGDSATHGGNLVLEGSPCVIGETLYVEAGSGHIYGLSLPDLEVVWDYQTGSDLDSTAVATRDGFLLCGIEKQYIAGHGGVIKLDPRKPAAEAAVWYLPTADRHFVDWDGGVIGSVAVNDEYDPEHNRPPLAAASAIDGYLYLFSQNETKGSALSFDGKTQMPTPVIVAKRYIGGSISTPLIVEDHVIAAGYDAKIHVYRIIYDAKEGSGVALKTRDGRSVRVSLVETGSFAGGASFESTPIVWNGRIYIGSRDGHLYCLGK